MKQLRFFFSLLCLIFLFGSCSSQGAKRQAEFQAWIQDNGKVKTLSTTAMIGDLVQQIGKDHVDNLTLIQGELDPHSYQLVKGDDEKLTFAHLIFYNGLGLEHGPSLQRHLQQNRNAIPLGDLIEQKEPQLIIRVQGQKDPHIWMDISLWAKTVPFIVEYLSRLDPTHAQEYQANAAQLEEQMAQAHEQVREIMQAVPAEERFLVSTHDAFKYFTRAYLAEEVERTSGDWQKRFAAPEGLAPESQLSTTDIKAIIDHMARYNIHILFSESNVSRDSIRKIVQAGREKGLDLKIACCPLYADAMGPTGSDGDTYLKMILYNANTIATHMNGRGSSYLNDK